MCHIASQQEEVLTLTLLQIIKDLQLLGLVAALLMADVILLVTWVLTDPIQCLQILSVSMTVRGQIPRESHPQTGLTSVDTQESSLQQEDKGLQEEGESGAVASMKSLPLSATTPTAPPALVSLCGHTVRYEHAGICLAVTTTSTSSIIKTFSYQQLPSPNCRGGGGSLRWPLESVNPDSHPSPTKLTSCVT